MPKPNPARRLNAVQCWAAAAMLALPAPALGQAIAVPTSQTGWFASKSPTVTFLFEAKDPKVTLVFIPGGRGSVGMQTDWKETHRHFSGYYFNRMLRRLGDPAVTSGRFNIVIFDNPAEMPSPGGWSAERTGSDHLSRIEDVVRFYREKLGKPIWLMGHSNGSISVTAFYKELQNRKQEHLIAGVIYSAGVSGTSFDDANTRLPVLILHHERDACHTTTPGNARRIYEQLKEEGNTRTELVLVTSGTRTPDNPNTCGSGFHMYFGAELEVTQAIDGFVGKYSESR